MLNFSLYRLVDVVVFDIDGEGGWLWNGTLAGLLELC